MIFFCSDTHFFHKNILKYSNRPFKDIEEMHKTFIRNWNTKISKNDTVYHLGDFALTKNPDDAIEILKQLNGQKYLIFGNHDRYLRKNKEFCSMFIDTKDLLEIKIQDKDAHKGFQGIVLCHYALRVWSKSHYGSWALHGHSHGTLPELPNSLSCDVGVDVWNYFPVSYEQIKQKMSTKTFKPIDHHTGHE